MEEIKNTHRPDAPKAARLPTRGQSEREGITGVTSAPVFMAVGVKKMSPPTNGQWSSHTTNATTRGTHDTGRTLHAHSQSPTRSDCDKNCARGIDDCFARRAARVMASSSLLSSIHTRRIARKACRERCRRHGVAGANRRDWIAFRRAGPSPAFLRERRRGRTGRLTPSQLRPSSQSAKRGTPSQSGRLSSFSSCASRSQTVCMAFSASMLDCRLRHDSCFTGFISSPPPSSLTIRNAAKCGRVMIDRMNLQPRSRYRFSSGLCRSGFVGVISKNRPIHIRSQILALNTCQPLDVRTVLGRNLLFFPLVDCCVTCQLQTSGQLCHTTRDVDRSLKRGF